MPAPRTILFERSIRRLAIGACLLALGSCRPMLTATGYWSANLPNNNPVTFEITQTGQSIAGVAVSCPNCGLVARFPTSGTFGPRGVTLDFDFPLLIAQQITPSQHWTFTGSFTGNNTIVGTVTSSTGLEAAMTLTKYSPPLIGLT